MMLANKRIDFLLEREVYANSDRPIALGRLRRDRSLVGRVHETRTAAGDDVAAHFGESYGDAFDVVVDVPTGRRPCRAEDRWLGNALQRASKTCELAGFGAVAARDPDLVEWDYGRFAGMLTKVILKVRSGWELFRDGCPDGESPRTTIDEMRVRDSPATRASGSERRRVVVSLV
jgi:hypothetical protein